MEPNQQSVVQIDEHNLDRECIRLPADYLRYAHLAAEAKRDIAESEAALSVTEAEVGRKIRANPTEYGLEKVTESGISALLQTNVRIKEAQEKVRNARYQADLSQAVVWALEHKKRSLTLLVELHGMGYFSNPKISERGKQAVEQMTQRKVRRRDDD